MIKVVLVTNIPAPYREAVYETVAADSDIAFHVIYCAKIEADRKWSFDFGNYGKSFLGSKAINYFNTAIHFSWGVFKHLKELNPDVVITVGFGPVMLQAFAWTLIKKRAHVPFTDGTIHSESHLTKVHRIIRRLIYKRSQCFIGASEKSLDLYRSYGVTENKLYKSCLCVDNSRFASRPFDQRPYDIMFSGQFRVGKMPFFFAEVGALIAHKRGSSRALVLGSGPLERDFRKVLDATELDVDFKGFIQPDDLPTYYASSKVLLFPTQSDAWGVVANEASASGTPVITCQNAGVSGELVQHGVNGFVLELNADSWAEEATDLLNNPKKWQKLSDAGPTVVQPFSSKQAACGIVDAVRQAVNIDTY